MYVFNLDFICFEMGIFYYSQMMKKYIISSNLIFMVLGKIKRRSIDCFQSLVKVSDYQGISGKPLQFTQHLTYPPAEYFSSICERKFKYETFLLQIHLNLKNFPFLKLNWISKLLCKSC